jgi:hypothetical protein
LSIGGGGAHSAGLQVEVVHITEPIACVETSALQRPYEDITTANTGLGQYLTNGDFPNPVADQTLAQTRTAERCAIVPENNRIGRLAISSAFTGGTTPNFKITVSHAEIPQ